MKMRSVCDCGAVDCPKCHPGCNTLVECAGCGIRKPRWMADDEGGVINWTWYCQQCHDNKMIKGTEDED